MIYFGPNGYLSDRTKDQMDSAVRNGIKGIFGQGQNNAGLYIRKGQLLRCPSEQSPANNPKNVTRDNSIPTIAARAIQDTNLSRHDLREVLWATVKRGFFSQSIERDLPGSRKLKRPHSFYKDSRPTADTLPMKFNWKTFKFENQLPPVKDVEIETRMFDGPDLFTPDHIYMMIKGAKIWWLYWYGLIAIPWLIFSIEGHGRSSHKEHNQLICMCKVYGDWAVNLFKDCVPTWKEDLREYWGSRGEIEYAEMIILDLDK